MAVEVRAQGVACPLICTYCYQNPLRDAGNIKVNYNIEILLKKVIDSGKEFSLFGGEPLLMPKDHMERFFQYGLEKFKKNSIQTNGLLIDQDHIRMFKEYNVHVGVSIDGMDELNDLRVYKNAAQTRVATATTIKNIELMAREGIHVGVILTLHKFNGTKERLPRLIEFIRYLGNLGVLIGNVHLLEADSALVKEVYSLTPEENTAAFLELAEFFEENRDLRYHPFTDMEKLMNFDDKDVMCIFKFCDPTNTQAVHGIEGNGDISNCTRTNKEGVDFFKAEGQGLQRSVSLWNTPQEFGGCQGCEYFIMCGGSCPGESIDGDMRNRTTHCSTLKATFGFYEDKAMARGDTPLTQRKDFKRIENMAIDSIYHNRVPSFADIKKVVDIGEVPPWAVVVPVYLEEPV